MKSYDKQHTLKCGCFYTPFYVTCWWNGYTTTLCETHQLEEDEMARIRLDKIKTLWEKHKENTVKELWVQMCDYPMYEISTHENVRNMQTNKVLKIRYNRNVFLRDKNNKMHWHNIQCLMLIHSKQLREEKEKAVTNYLEENGCDINPWIKNCMIIDYCQFDSLDTLYNMVKHKYDKYYSWMDDKK